MRTPLAIVQDTLHPEGFHGRGVRGSRVYSAGRMKAFVPMTWRKPGIMGWYAWMHSAHFAAAPNA